MFQRDSHESGFRAVSGGMDEVGWGWYVRREAGGGVRAVADSGDVVNETRGRDQSPSLRDLGSARFRRVH